MNAIASHFSFFSSSVWDSLESLSKGSISSLVSGMPYVYSLQSLYLFHKQFAIYTRYDVSALYWIWQYWMKSAKVVGKSKGKREFREAKVWEPQHSEM